MLKLNSTVDGHWNGTQSSAPGQDSILTLVIFVMACLGMPGNLLVFIVFSYNLKTSIRLYIFSLAISDAVICVTVIVTRVLRIVFEASRVTNLVAMAVISVAGAYSLFLLTVTAVERYLCVSRPHSFTFSQQRARVVLCALVPCSMAMAAVVIVPKFWGMPLLSRLLAVVVQCSCTLIIITMYALMARIIWIRTRARRAAFERQISMTTLVGARALRRANGACGGIEVVRPCRGVSSASPGRGVWMLFVITVVFIMCWLPLWMAQGGVSMPTAVINLFILLNSVINPLIYSFMSEMFREDVRKYYRRTFTRSNSAFVCSVHTQVGSN